MKPETAEWIDKAEGDWKVAQREMQAPDPVWNVVCFLAEQCAEKYLKGFLEEQNIAFQKIHGAEIECVNAEDSGVFGSILRRKRQHTRTRVEKQSGQGERFEGLRLSIPFLLVFDRAAKHRRAVAFQRLSHLCASFRTLPVTCGMMRSP